MRHAGLNLLLDETVSVQARGCRILLGGLDYCRRRELGQRVRRTLPPPDRAAADLRLVLAHHPDAFDSTSQRAIDLTLCGHTHG